MSSLNLDLDYFEHPKTKRLIGLLGKGADVMPIKLWCYVGKYHAEDGILTGHSVQEIESIVGWWRDPGEAVEALVKVGFLAKKGEAYRVHQWKEHSGHIHAYRERATKGAIAKWARVKRAASSIATSNAQSNGKHSPISSNSNSVSKKDKMLKALQE